MNPTYGKTNLISMRRIYLLISITPFLLTWDGSSAYMQLFRESFSQNWVPRPSLEGYQEGRNAQFPWVDCYPIWANISNTKWRCYKSFPKNQLKTLITLTPCSVGRRDGWMHHMLVEISVIWSHLSKVNQGWLIMILFEILIFVNLLKISKIQINEVWNSKVLLYQHFLSRN